MEAEMTSLLEIRNIETYYGPVMAIKGVSLEVREGQIVSLLGANGAGKTTVLKTISGAMDPQKGTVSLAGEEIQSRDPDVIARMGVAHVPEGREVFPFLSVAENLQVGAFSRRDGKIQTDGRPAADARDRQGPDAEAQDHAAG
jgi:branched-chain amino acid transport system ATP-binding protein